MNQYIHASGQGTIITSYPGLSVSNYSSRVETAWWKIVRRPGSRLGRIRHFDNQGTTGVQPLGGGALPYKPILDALFFRVSFLSA